MKPFTEKLIEVIDRILWASRMASLTSPTYWGRCSHCDETSPWVTSVRDADACTRCAHDERSHAEAHAEVGYRDEARRLAHA